MFNTSQPDPDAIARVKALFTEAFQLPDDTLLSLAELRCHELGCPPIETVITARAQGAGMRDWRIGKPIAEITEADIALLTGD
ncbi:MAG: hypothetical protein ABJH45_23325 [Paracoccaceae bacterium]